MEISFCANMGERCAGEQHRFRVGVQADAATEFVAYREHFYDALTDAMIDHCVLGRPGSRLYIQVWTTPTAKWRNVQNPSSGNVVVVSPEIAGLSETADTLFCWACNSVQMCRDIDSMSSGLVRCVTEP